MCWCRSSMLPLPPAGRSLRPACSAQLPRTRCRPRGVRFRIPRVSGDVRSPQSAHPVRAKPWPPCDRLARGRYASCSPRSRSPRGRAPSGLVGGRKQTSSVNQGGRSLELYQRARGADISRDCFDSLSSSHNSSRKLRLNAATERPSNSPTRKPIRKNLLPSPPRQS